MARRRSPLKGKKHRKWGHVSSHVRRVKGVFGIAASDKAYKRAKAAAKRAAAKVSAAWKKAQAKAKKKMRKLSRVRRRRYSY
jgi:hypothetical protein